jgi:hypothetical protein
LSFPRECDAATPHLSGIHSVCICPKDRPSFQWNNDTKILSFPYGGKWGQQHPVWRQWWAHKIIMH